MNSRDAYAALRKLGAVVINTSDAAAAWRQSTSAASRMLARLAAAGLIESIRHGTWWVDGPVDPFALPQYLSMPFESYVSLQSALHLHGLIEQVAEVIYAVTLARTQRMHTRVGTYSFHHVAPELFGGYVENRRGVRLASAEKALFDYAYLSAGKSRLFTALPELELPHGFREKELHRWLARIASARSRTLTANKLEALLSKPR